MSYLKASGRLICDDPDIPKSESYFLRQLYKIFRNVLVHRTVTKIHVKCFLLFASAVQLPRKYELIIYDVLFRGVVVHVPHKRMTSTSEMMPIYTLLKKVVDTPCIPNGRLEPFTRGDILLGLASTYAVPGIGSRAVFLDSECPTNTLPNNNFHFHALAAGLYQTAVLPTPFYFVLAMRDALEIGNQELEELALVSASACLWINAAGPQLFSQTKNGSSLGDIRVLHRSLYDNELDKVYGYRPMHTVQDVTIDRWRFWLKRLEGEIADVIEYERPKGIDPSAGRTAIEILRELMPKEEDPTELLAMGYDQRHSEPATPESSEERF